MNLIFALQLKSVKFNISRSFLKCRTFLQNGILYNESTIKFGLHMMENEGSVVVDIYLFCYAVKVYDPFCF